jgi:flagellar protein FliO/FliZ
MDLVAALRSALALGVTLGLLALLAFVAMRFDFVSLFGGTSSGARTRKLADLFTRKPGDNARRLSVVEQRLVDARNRLLIVRWDDMEHLVIVGAGDATLVASKPAVAANDGSGA